MIDALEVGEPLPEYYADWDQYTKSSNSLEKDLYCLSALDSYADHPIWPGPISSASLDWIKSLLHPKLWDMFQRFESGETECIFDGLSFLDGEYVGSIHHIPKKGTVKRRPIAAPNRFLQMAMMPASVYLDLVVRQIRNDCTFNQAKMDRKITNRVNNTHLYVGSVDLSQATDNLPFSWGCYLWDNLFRPKVRETANKSWDLFIEVTHGKWLNDGLLSTWTVGQPLGCRPSFGTLAITHNLLLESLSLALGYGHSPYAVLGDDVVIFTKKLRSRYIREFRNRGIPLSLHKSYEGNLTEFAGKTYIKGVVPFNTPDQGAITFTNLFDWQRVSNIPIPYSHLPKKVKSRIEREVEKNSLDKGKAQAVYETAQRYLMVSRYLPIRKDEGALMELFAESLPVDEKLLEAHGLRRERVIPDRPALSGIVMIHDHPITYLNYGYADKHGHKQRYREVQLPAWYKHKFRPYGTAQLIRCGSIAVKGRQSDDM
jgi:hypothetical protein